MRTVLVVAFLFPTLAFAQGTPECYATFGDSGQGKKCCDASFKKNARGKLPNETRMAGLNACMKKAAK